MQQQAQTRSNISNGTRFNIFLKLNEIVIIPLITTRKALNMHGKRTKR